MFKKKKEKIPIVKKSMWNLISIWRYEHQYDCFRNENGKFIDILQIQTKNLRNISDSEIEYDILKTAKLYKVIGCDTKIIAMNFPCSTSSQRKYVRSLIEKTRNPSYLERLNEKYAELEMIERSNSSREYFIMFFCGGLEEFVNTRISIIQNMQQGNKEIIFQIPEEKKIRILYKMANKNRIL